MNLFVNDDININMVTGGGYIGTNINYKAIKECLSEGYLDDTIVGIQLGKITIGDVFNKQKKKTTRKTNSTEIATPNKTFNDNLSIFIKTPLLKKLKIKVFSTGKISIPNSSLDLEDDKIAIESVIEKFKDMQADLEFNGSELIICDISKLQIKNLIYHNIKCNSSFKYISYIDIADITKFIEQNYSDKMKIRKKKGEKYSGSVFNNDGNTITIFSTGSYAISSKSQTKIYEAYNLLNEIIQRYIINIINANKLLYCKITRNRKTKQVNIRIYNKIIGNNKIINLQSDQSFSINLGDFITYITEIINESGSNSDILAPTNIYWNCLDTEPDVKSDVKPEQNEDEQNEETEGIKIPEFDVNKIDKIVIEFSNGLSCEIFSKGNVVIQDLEHSEDGSSIAKMSDILVYLYDFIEKNNDKLIQNTTMVRRKRVPK